MEERIGNLTRRESMSIGCGDRVRTRRRFQAGLLKWYLAIFVAILLGLAALLIKPADPMLASITSTSRNFQGTRGANTTKGANAGKADAGPRTRAAAPCADKTKRYTDCGNGT